MHQDTICVALQRIPENILAADFAGNAVISRRTKKKKKKREEEEEEERRRRRRREKKKLVVSSGNIFLETSSLELARTRLARPFFLCARLSELLFLPSLSERTQLVYCVCVC